MQPYTGLLLLFAAAAPEHAVLDQQAVMDEIERAIILPDGALPPWAYGRNYALSGSGNVVATYLRPTPPSSVDDFCGIMEEVEGRYITRSCTEIEARERAASDARNRAAQTPAGQRRWYEDPEGLPYYNDGACMQVNVRYDVENHRFAAVYCNGRA